MNRKMHDTSLLTGSGEDEPPPVSPMRIFADWIRGMVSGHVPHGGVRPEEMEAYGFDCVCRKFAGVVCIAEFHIKQ